MAGRGKLFPPGSIMLTSKPEVSIGYLEWGEATFRMRKGAKTWMTKKCSPSTSDSAWGHQSRGGSI